MLVAPTALMLQSCCCHVRETVDEEEHIEQPSIMMGVASAGTKAVIDGSDANARLANMVGQCFTGTPATLKQNAGFGVYSYKSTTGNPTILFDNEQVHPDPEYNENSPESTPWTYSPTRFWDMTSNYQFIAYWPYTIVTYTTNSEDKGCVEVETDNNGTHTLTFHNIPNWQQIRDTDGDGDVDADDGTVGIAEETDYMTSTETGYYGEDFPDGIVNFKFHHLLSQLIVKAYYINGSNTATTDGVFINKITLERSGDANDVPALDGKTNFTHVFGATLATAGTITYAESSTILNLAEANARPVAWKNEWVSSPNFAPSVIGRWLMVPHVWNGIKIKVSHKDDNTGYKNSDPIEITLGKQEDDYATLPGKTYIITLIINVANGGITVADIAVRDWLEPQKAIKEVYNW